MGGEKEGVRKMGRGGKREGGREGGRDRRREKTEKKSSEGMEKGMEGWRVREVGGRRVMEREE